MISCVILTVVADVLEKARVASIEHMLTRLRLMVSARRLEAFGQNIGLLSRPMVVS
jgi:hypothetical protein